MVIAGSRSFATIRQWAADAGRTSWSKGAVRGAAEESTFRAFDLRHCPLLDVLDRVLDAWR